MQLYWINNEEIKLVIKDKIEILTPDKLIVKYGENKEIMNQIQELLKNPKNDFLTIYDKILNESRYDEKYATLERINDNKQNLSAYEVMIKNIMRTKKDKKGTDIAYSMRIKDELDNLDIENYIIEIINNDIKHYANLYIEDKTLFVADISLDLIDKEYQLDDKDEVYTSPKNIRIPLKDYLFDNEVAYVQEPITDTPKKLNQLQKQSIKSFVINFELFS